MWNKVTKKCPTMLSILYIAKVKLVKTVTYTNIKIISSNRITRRRILKVIISLERISCFSKKLWCKVVSCS